MVFFLGKFLKLGRNLWSESSSPEQQIVEPMSHLPGRLYLSQGCEYFCFHISLGESGITMGIPGTLHWEKIVFKDTTTFLRTLVDMS